MKDRKTSHKVYAAWEYEKEIEDLNKQSCEGWQLVKGGCFHSIFEKDTSKRYIYQLDYTPNLEDKDRYIELFEEAGWEYINSTYNNWNYFRKPYEEGFTEEDQFIYTDTQSLYEMQNRYVRMVNVFAAIFILETIVFTYCVITEFSIGRLIEWIGNAVMAFMFTMARINISRKRKEQKPILDIPIRVFYPIAMLLLLVAVFLI